MENILKEIFAIINDLIKFAEAKNAGLIVFNGAVAFAMIDQLNKESIDPLLFWIFIYVGVCNIISLLISISSLYAQTSSKRISQRITHDENLLFYGTISKMTPNEYINALKEKYKLKSECVELELDIAKQVIVVSQISIRKFNRFNIALAFTISSLISPIGWLIIHCLFNPNKK